MGAQIGAEYALAGHEVTLVTRSTASGERALQRAQGALRALVASGLAPEDRAAAVRLATSQDVRAACAGRDLIVESVAEDLNAKADVLDAAARAAPDATLCSNTSSIPITRLGEAARAPDRMVGTHYANPAILMPLVEVIPGRATDRRRLDDVVAVLEGVGKQPIVVPDVPGFLWNRLQFAVLREAARLVIEHGVPPETVDVAMRRTLGRRWSLVGPFETMALGGRETFMKIARLVFEELDRPVDPAVLEQVQLPEPGSLRGLAAQRDARLLELKKRDQQEASS